MRLTVVSVWVRCVMVSVPQVEHLQAAALHDPTEPLYHVHMAGLLANVGQLADAQRHAEDAIDRNPQDPSAHLLLASVLASQLQQARATPHATVQAMRRKLHQALVVAHDLDPHNPRTCLRLAMLGLDFSRLSAEDVLGRSATVATGNEQPMPCTSCVSLPWVVVVVVCGLLTEGRGSARRLVQCAQLATHRIAADSGVVATAEAIAALRDAVDALEDLEIGRYRRAGVAVDDDEEFVTTQHAQAAAEAGYDSAVTRISQTQCIGKLRKPLPKHAAPTSAKVVQHARPSG